jgi:hypothetical protein
MRKTKKSFVPPHIISALSNSLYLKKLRSAFRRIISNRSDDDWAVGTRPFYRSDPFKLANRDPQARAALMEECPLGFVSTAIIRAFMCAGTESFCFEHFASLVDELFLNTPPHAFIASEWPILPMLQQIQWNLQRHTYSLDFTREALESNLRTLAYLAGTHGYHPDAWVIYKMCVQHNWGEYKRPEEHETLMRCRRCFFLASGSA